MTKEQIMNNSKRTRIIARGIYLYSCVQDVPGDQLDGSIEQKAWNRWKLDHTKYIEFVINEQYKLFNRVNVTF